ncbi:hypothetical protein D3C73_1636360 [compost metagenome]
MYRVIPHGGTGRGETVQEGFLTFVGGTDKEIALTVAEKSRQKGAGLINAGAGHFQQ